MSNPQFSDSEMKEIFESFVVETRELLDALSSDLMLLESEPENMDLMNQIFRSVHTIKGTAGFMGFEQIQTITHKGEDLLNKLRKAELHVTQEIIDALLEVYDWIVVLLEKIENGDNEKVNFDSTVQQLVALINGQGQNGNSVVTTPETVATTTQSAGTGDALSAIVNNPDFGKGTGDDFTDDEEAALQAAFAQINKGFTAPVITAASATTPKPEVISVAEVATTEQVQEPRIPLAKDKPAESKQVDKNAASADTTIRVDVGRVEVLMNLSGELVLGRNRLQQIAEKLHTSFEGNELVRELLETATQVDFVTSEIQTSVMRMRMVPIAKLYQKAPRIVRDISREVQKEIELVLKGEETELDRTIIEELNDPLIHMIRNACDHGIESPEECEATGKLRKGKVVLDAEQEGNMIVIKIIDDGKGMDPEKLKSKAVEKGILAPEQAAALSAKEAFQLIFAPGFSMAKVVSNISGRGVGMDVVRTNIQKLKGIIDIDSELGKGTTFTIKLPLTLAIIQGLLVKAGNEVYTLPLSSVIEVVAVNPDSICTVNQRQVVRIREQVFPILRLDSTLSAPDLYSTEIENKYIVVIGLAEQRIGVVVDELLGQQEIVIKSLGQYLGHIEGITGSTILGDGSVVMIIDIAELIEIAKREAGALEEVY
ncbi:MAG: chemotaxis protein CheA [Candidatus Kapaibacterium sp.]